MPKMTDAEVMSLLRSDSLWNKARAVFSSAAAEIDQAGRQRKAPGPVEVRRMEFEAVRRILLVLGCEFALEPPATTAPKPKETE